MVSITNGRDSSRSVSYTYDQVNRLSSAQTSSTLEGNIAAGAQLAAAGVGLINGLATNDGVGAAANIVSGQITFATAAAANLGVPLAKAVPIVGNIFSAALAVRDIVHGIQDYEACLAGH